jgi:N-acyl-D-aspartate/D-glutamate deacylase
MWDFDLVIAGGRVVDGSGASAIEADLAIKDGLIAEIGPGLASRARRVIEADGMLVTPGFVDIHTHYDAQVTWDPEVSPSSWHGVTTVVMGNCGVGFAPVREADRRWLLGLMEGVEDIPGAAMTEGMVWNWETFPQYMDTLDALPLCIDVATQIPHGALRTYVMGRRGARQEEASAEELDEMGRLVEEAIRCGALGFSTSRTLIHKGIDGEYVPGTFAPEAEVFAIGRAMQRAGAGVFQLTSNHVDMADEFDWFSRLARETGRPVSFNLLQSDQAPELWKTLLEKLDSAHDAPIFAQISGRPNGIMMTWGGTAHPFLLYPSYMPLHHLPLEERLTKLREPGFREKLVSETPFSAGEFEDFIMGAFDKMFLLGEQPDYEPEGSKSAAAIAEREGRSPKEVVFDWLMQDDGKGIVYFPIFNYSHQSMDVLHELLQHPKTRLGLGDGGAHCGVICDASIQSFMLTHWTRDRTRGPTFSLESMVKTCSSETARAYGLLDRGRLAPGYRADVNVIDYDQLQLGAPYMAHDLPTGARRLLQRAGGYRYTLVAGEIAFESGKPTDARQGRLIRGPQAAPPAPSPSQA